MIQPFPIGAKLRLEDGRYAAVVKYNRQNPFKPTVVAGWNEHNQPIPREELQPPIDLSEHPETRLDSYRGENLSFLYHVDQTEEVPARQTIATLLDAAYP